MIEARAVIESIEKAKSAVESLGGELKSNYAFKDIIFIPKSGNFDLNKEFVRIRVYTKTDWPTKDVVLIKKQAEWKKQGKVDKTLLKKEFDTEQEAFDFIEKNLPDLKKGFEYSREGWQYQLGNSRIFIEDIKGYKPTIEIEAEDKLDNLFDKIGVLEKLKDSVPEIIRKNN